MAYLVTGAMGCIGAWTLYHLLQRGEHAVSFDISDDWHRLDLLMTREEQAGITFVQGDLTNLEQLKEALQEYKITHIIHLAALQVPFCKANPPLGAQVNVTGTVNVFEAARLTDLRHVVYASSIAVYGAPEDYPSQVVVHDTPMLPRTLYGVYKVASENLARVYWQDYLISSTALRPYIVYGVGRDQGLTSEATKALQAAARGEDYHIRFGGKMQFHWASDVAQQFIDAAMPPLEGAYGFNLGSPPTDMETFVQLVMGVCPESHITYDDIPLPFPSGCDANRLASCFSHVYETPLEQGIRHTIEHYRRLSK